MESTAIRFACRTDVGKLRDHQEDSFLWYDPSNTPEALRRKGRLYVVADGMGGHAAGEVASGLAVQTIVERYQTDPGNDILPALLQAIAAANTAIYQQAQSGNNSGMGTTVVCVVLRDRELYVAHVGDSRAYLLRENELTQLTEDHTVVNELVRRGQMTAEEAVESPRKHILSRALGTMPTVPVDSQGPISLQISDVIILCTDGVSQQIAAEQIGQDVRLALEDPQAAADALIAHANASGGHDNATAIVLRIEQAVPETESVPAPPPKQPVPVPKSVPPPPPNKPVQPQQPPGTRRPWIVVALMLTIGLCLGCSLGYLGHDPVFRLITTPTPVPPTQTPWVAITRLVITATPTRTPTPSPTLTDLPTFTPSPTASMTPTPTWTATATSTPVRPATPTPSRAVTATRSPTVSVPLSSSPTKILTTP